MEEIQSFILTAKDGTSLYGREWPVKDPKSVICLIHGLGEHIGRYEHVAEFLNANQVSLFGLDLRGHGQSEGKRGHTPSHEMLLNDVEELLMYARAEYNDLPIFLYGHSLGGNIVANYILQKNTNELQGVIISSPWLELAEEPADWQLKLAKFFSNVVPSLTQSNRLNVGDLTNDDEINLAYKNDPLVHDRISTRMFISCYRQGLWALENAPKNKLPLLVFHGSEDAITSSHATQAFAKNAADEVTYKLWEGTKHEPHNDMDKKEVLRTMSEWILQKST